MSTPKVRTPSNANWLSSYHERMAAGSERKSTPRRQLFSERKVIINSPVVMLPLDSGHSSDAESHAPRWSVESASSAVKHTPIAFAATGYSKTVFDSRIRSTPFSVDSTYKRQPFQKIGWGRDCREGVAAIRFDAENRRPSERGPSICVLPTPDLPRRSSFTGGFTLTGPTRKRQRPSTNSVKK